METHQYSIENTPFIFVALFSNGIKSSITDQNLGCQKYSGLLTFIINSASYWNFWWSYSTRTVLVSSSGSSAAKLCGWTGACSIWRTVWTWGTTSTGATWVFTLATHHLFSNKQLFLRILALHSAYHFLIKLAHDNHYTDFEEKGNKTHGGTTDCKIVLSFIPR